ncbi:MAG TPA: Rrf2 family transcriptional regulator [Gammaproteobacteria bacterium]|jgi:Rrf2 family nitric oxide-sensitive transcriptional repressor|nr:Rrf2 family transcriptional regulator [Gammaproteobacteria bacterium]
MRITRYTDYSVRTLIYLGVKGEGLSTIQEIADSYGISKNHLMKVVHDLQLRGYIDTIRGKNGGLRLRLPPEEISIGRLVRETEEDKALVECFGPDNTCVITPFCDLKHVLAEAQEAFFKVLDGYTLADMLNPKRRSGLEQALMLGGVPVSVA